VVLTDAAELRLVELAFGADQGARDLERAITRFVIAPIARLLTDVRHEPDSTLEVDASPDSSEFSITVSDGAGPAGSVGVEAGDPPGGRPARSSFACRGEAERSPAIHRVAASSTGEGSPAAIVHTRGLPGKAVRTGR